MNIVFIIGSIIVYLFSSILSSFEINPFYRMYYLFAWYSYIFFVDGVIYSIKKQSLVISQIQEFIYMLFVSSGMWFVFEIFNISLKNWSYIMLPFDNQIRYFGYIASYATVLPAIFETTQLIETIGIFKKIPKIKTKIVVNPNKIIYIGTLLTLFTIIFPKYLFPFIWVSPLLITEGFNLKLQTRSLIRELNAGNIRKIFDLSLAGLVCGFLWEFFNYKAGAKWIYHLPYLNTPKIFEMPIWGYIGFSFFALECYSFYNLLSYFKNGITWEEDARIPINQKNPKYFYFFLFIAILIITIISIKLIDKYTVKSFTIF